MKQKFLAAAMLMLGTAFGASAQTVVLSGQEAAEVYGTPPSYEVGSFEIELKSGFANSLISPPKDYKNYSQLTLGVECRRNMGDGHWAFGGQLGLLGTMSMDKDVDLSQGIDYSRAEIRGGYYIGPVAEYEWSRGADFSPFAGVGAGLMAGSTSGVYFMPKIGAEISRFVRCGFSAMLNPSGCASLNLDLGIVFGGYRK